ncbi:MAG: DUF5131 family protein [Chloroflexi bacterium]|nr:DUF5131 family protein [Chloroflexota bacterium]
MSAMSPAWVDRSWNPITGCWGSHRHLCSAYCHAESLAKHLLRERYSANPHVAPNCDPADAFAPRIWPERFREPASIGKPSTLLVCSMGELFSGWVPSDWIARVIAIIRNCPQHTFLVVTREPQNVHWWNPLPDNFWIGAAAIDGPTAEMSVAALASVKAKVKFLHLPPRLAETNFGRRTASRLASDFQVSGGLQQHHHILTECAPETDYTLRSG